MKKRIMHQMLSVLLIFGMLLTSITFPTTVNAEQTAQQENEERRVSTYQTDAGWGVDPSVGYVPSDIQALRGTLPKSYSSADVNISVDTKKDYVTSVKDQGNYGTCWAFTAISLAESSYIINEGANPDNVNFNESHLVHYTYNTPNDLLGITGGDTFGLTSTQEDASLLYGGNNYFSMQSLANWVGLSNDANFNEDDVDGTHSDAFAYQDAAHLENAYIISVPYCTDDKTSFQTEMDIMKSMIMEYGSVGISYYSYSDQYDNGEDDGYYYYPFVEYGGNHAVTVVGWDDTISAELLTFNYGSGNGTITKMEPQADGAWLIKNSWGEYGQFSGYFWLSYYDKNLGNEGYVFDVVSAGNYDNNYHHDGSAYTSGMYTGTSSICSQASVFVADSNESLEAVGFYTQNTNANYEIRVYKNIAQGENPQDGDLVLTQSGTETYIGFHTVDLSNSVMLKSGDRYAVVVTISTSGETTYATVSTAVDGGWFVSDVNAKAGESYIGVSVDTLEDMNANATSYTDGVDVCIKAFTNEVIVVEETGISLNVTSASMDSGSTLQLAATISPSNATYKGVTYITSDASLATVDAKGLVTANATGKAGTVTITATSEYKHLTTSCTITVLPVKVSGIAVDKTNVTVVEGTTFSLQAVVTPMNATNGNVVWSSSDTSLATVDTNGNVSALKPGTVTITATAEDGSGKSASCILTISAEDKRADIPGSDTTTGWVYYQNTWYYLINGEVQTGWIKDGGTWYYLDDTGAMQTGWVNDGGTWYYMNSSGAMQTGWIKDGGTWYYLKSSGAMATGWIYDGAWYYLKSSGAMAVGWLWDGANWYYLTASGAMATGWLWDGANWYYLTSSGAMATGWIYTGGEWYYLNSSGAMHTGWLYVGGEWYYLRSSGDMVTGRYKVDGKTYYFDSSGAWIR